MNKNISQQATARIRCNEDSGTALIYYPHPEVDYVYILTAKHCLKGENFDKEFTNDGVVLDKIFNQDTKEYHSYQLSSTDIIFTSRDEEDIALLILRKSDILPLTGKQFFCQVINTDTAIHDYDVRGFASFNDQEVDRLFNLKFIEDQKENPNLFTLRSENSLDTYYQQAMENVGGLSGSGAYAHLHDSIYLTGIINTYENGNIFIATKILAFNKLIPSDKYKLFEVFTPETDPVILASYVRMETNHRTVDKRTRETIGVCNVPRDYSNLLHEIKNSSLVVIHGLPGVGKSALAKATVAKLKEESNYSIITLTAENLYCETLEEAFSDAGYNANIEQILRSPLSGTKTLIWIESFEKLIESGYSGAFNELLESIKSNGRLTIIMTIREYLLQNFRINFRYELPDHTMYHHVGAFNDQEIEIVCNALPELIPLLGNEKINHLLRIPYYLDKAARIIPVLLQEAQLDERKFKNLMWERLVENGNKVRGTVFYNIAIKRAREMSLFTTYSDNETVLTELVADNILQFDDSESFSSYCPSHDILEDWALIRYIGEQKKEMPDAKSFLLSLEFTPAIKRAFRLWMEEQYRLEPNSSVSFVHSLLFDGDLSEAWKEELMIVSLRSDHAAVLLETLKNQFLEDNASFLEQIVFMLQTSCKKLDPTKKDFDHLLPAGSGWDYIIDFIKDNFSEISKLDSFEIKYLNLIESWAKQLPDFNQSALPASAKSAAWLLEEFIHRNQKIIGSYGKNMVESSELKIYLKILFKLTSSDINLISPLIKALCNPQQHDERWTNTATLDLISSYIINGVISDQICRFFPEDLLRLTTDIWINKEEPPKPGSLQSIFQETPRANDFGLKKHIDSNYNFPSGYQTFFYWLFMYHPEKALDFIIPFLNKAFVKNWEVSKSLNNNCEIITILFEDGSENSYFGTAEYWSLFRGYRLHSRLISSLLMALEAGLLNLIDKKEFETTQLYLKRLIKESNNVAILGIVSSIIQAQPNLLDEISVSLFGIRTFFEWDIKRYTDEFQSNTVYNRDNYLKQERIASNALIHRKKYLRGLMGFVVDYVFYHKTYNKQLFKYIDILWENAPQDDHLWRKFLFDMDVRKYELNPVDQEGYENFVQLVPGYDDDVKKNVTNNNDRANLPQIGSVWAKKAFDNDSLSNYNYETWKIGFDFIQNQNGQFHFMTSPGAMACIGIRDFSEQLQPVELIWCSDTIIDSASKKLLPYSPSITDLDVFAKEAILLGLSYLFKTKLPPSINLQIKELIFSLLIADLNEEDRKYLQYGIAQHLINYEPDFVINCWYGLLDFITHEKEINDEQAEQSFAHWDDRVEKSKLNIRKTWRNALIKSVVEGTIEKPSKISLSLYLRKSNYLDDALRLIPYNTDFAVHLNMLEQLLQFHLDSLNSKDTRTRDAYFENKHVFIFFYPRFVLNQPDILSTTLFKELLELSLQTDKTNEYLLFVYDLVKEFISAVANGAPQESFWKLWESLRLWIIENKRVFFMPLFLMDLDWNKNSNNWHILEGKNLYYKQFITEWGANIINPTVKFLGGIAFHRFMPDSVSWVPILLLSQNAEKIDKQLLEQFAENAFYGYGAKIKSDQILLRCLLFILDFLIKKGSPKAYMLKDELLQYK